MSIIANCITLCLLEFQHGVQCQVINSKQMNIQKRCISLLFGKRLNIDHAEFYKTCARTRTIDEHFAPKNFVLEHTKPLFTEYAFLTVHNLLKLFLRNEIFKIKKFRYPISLHTFKKIHLIQ